MVANFWLVSFKPSIIGGGRLFVLPSLALGLACLVLFPTAVVAQPSPFVVQIWQTENGLPHNLLTDVIQGKEGYLWIGTFNGLTRFDGKMFTVFNSENTPELADSWVDHLFATPDGTLWIGTHHGGLSSFSAGRFARELPVRPDEDWVVKYLGQRTNEFLFLTMAGRVACGQPGAMRVLDLPVADQRSAVMDGEGVVWFFRPGRLEGSLTDHQYESFTNVPGLAELRCNDLCVDAGGRVWAGTDDGLRVWKNRQFVRVWPAAGELPQAVKHIYPCRNESLWVNANGRLRQWRNNGWVAEADSDWPPFQTPMSIVREDWRGNLWFSSTGEGLLRLTPEGLTLRVGSAQGLPNDRVAGLCVDAEDNLWVALDRGGLARVRSRRFSVVRTSPDAPEPAAVSVCQDHTGIIWVGTYGAGLVGVESNRITHYTSGRDGDGNLDFAAGGSKGEVMSVLADREGRVWAGTEIRGVFRLTNGVFATPFALSDIGWQARVIYEDHLGRIWFGNSLGLYLWNHGHLEACHPPAGVSRLEVRAILDDGAGGVWVGTREQGLYHFQDGQWRMWRQASGLGSDTVWTIFADDQNALWLGTQAGLVRFKDNQFVRLTTSDGLPADAIYHLMSDGHGWLWAASQNGIFRVKLDDLNAFARGDISGVNCLDYDRSDGLPTIQCSAGSQPAGWRGAEGKLWFTTENGVVQVDPGNLTRNTRPPPVIIETMKVDQELQPIPLPTAAAPEGISPGALSPIRIAPGHESFEFVFTALSFTAPEKVRFRYRVEGLGTKWLYADDRRSAHYSSLPPGDFVFHVTACNDDGVWNDTGATLPFVVLPWFWQTVWFKVVTGLAVIGVAVAVVRNIERRRARGKLAELERERELDQERARIARDIHDDLGASVTQVAFLGDLTGRSADRPEAVRRHSQHIADAAREMAQSLDAIVWAVKPSNDTLRNLIEYLHRRTNELLENLPRRYTFALPPQIPERIVSAELRHNVFLAYKEALTNILKHAQTSEVAIRIALDADTLQIDIRDNGRGFDPAGGQTDRSGQQNMRRRLEEIGGTFEVISQPGQGTILKMHIPLAARPPIPKI